MRHRLGVVIALLACISVTASAQIALKFGPESFSTFVEGQAVKFTGSGTASLFTPQGAQQMDITVDLTVDLSDFQRVVPIIVQAKGNRSDSCSEVVNLHTVRLSSSADLYVGGHFEKWFCTYLFNNVVGKTKIEQDGDVTIGLSLAVAPGGKALDIRTQAKNPHFNGVLQYLASNSLTGSYVTNWVLGAIQRQLDPGNLKQAFPAGLNAFNPTIVSAKFIDLGSGKLGANAVFKFSLSQSEAQKLLDQLRKK